jgi:hypothetical protein
MSRKPKRNFARDINRWLSNQKNTEWAVDNAIREGRRADTVVGEANRNSPLQMSERVACDVLKFLAAPDPVAFAKYLKNTGQKHLVFATGNSAVVRELFPGFPDAEYHEHRFERRFGGETREHDRDDREPRERVHNRLEYQRDHSRDGRDHGRDRGQGRVHDRDHGRERDSNIPNLSELEKLGQQVLQAEGRLEPSDHEVSCESLDESEEPQMLEFPPQTEDLRDEQSDSNLDSEPSMSKEDFSDRSGSPEKNISRPASASGTASELEKSWGDRVDDDDSSSMDYEGQPKFSDE